MRYLLSIVSFAISMLAIAISAVSESVVKVVMEFDKSVMAAVDSICQLGQSLKTRYTKVIGSGSGGMTVCYGFVSMRRSLDASSHLTV